MGFRDDWMREGKAKDTNTVIEPMHLVLVEEPEAHLHISVPPYINQGLMWLQDYLHPED